MRGRSGVLFGGIFLSGTEGRNECGLVVEITPELKEMIYSLDFILDMVNNYYYQIVRLND